MCHFEKSKQSTTRTILLLTFILISSLTNTQAQTCDCGKDFDFLSTAYIKDYSGIQDFAKKYPDYLQFIDNLSKKANKIKDIKKCYIVIGELIR